MFIVRMEIMAEIRAITDQRRLIGGVMVLPLEDKTSLTQTLARCRREVLTQKYREKAA